MAMSACIEKMQEKQQRKGKESEARINIGNDDV